MHSDTPNPQEFVEENEELRTRLHEAEETLRAIHQEEKLARSILEQAAEAIVVCNEIGMIMRASHAAEDLCGCTPLLMPFNLMFPLQPTNADQANPVGQFSFDAVLEGERFTGLEVMFKRSDGALFQLLLNAGPLFNADNEIRGSVITMTDIRELKAAKEELARQANELAEANRDKDNFIAMMAHELRNPLAPILNSVYVMQARGGQNEIQERFLNIIERQSRHMARLVDDLLDVSRVNQGKIELRKERIEFGAVVHLAVESCASLFEDRGHELAINLPKKPIWMEADSARLEQIIVNLLTNAAKYTEPNGHIWLSAVCNEDELVFRVHDTGMGIPHKMLAKIFEPFCQIERTIDRSKGGLGLGLTLVKGLVDLHQGTIEAHSEGIGKGSEFVVQLPIANRKQETIQLATEEGSDPKEPSKRILVVEDCVDGTSSMAKVMQLWGYEVQLAPSGPVAIGLAAKLKPQIILLDIGRSITNGCQLAEALRQQPCLASALIVAITGLEEIDERNQAKRSGIDHLLTRPIDYPSLQELLGSYFEGPRFS